MGRYTKQTWGNAQARRYREELELALKKLSLSPRIGLERDEIAPQVAPLPWPPTPPFTSPKGMGSPCCGYCTRAWISNAHSLFIRNSHGSASDRSSCFVRNKGSLPGFRLMVMSERCRRILGKPGSNRRQLRCRPAVRLGESKPRHISIKVSHSEDRTAFRSSVIFGCQYRRFR